MSTLRMHRPPASPAAGFVHFFSLLTALLEALIEAQRDAAIAHKRYPFAEW